MRKVNALYEVEEETGSMPKGLWYIPLHQMSLMMRVRYCWLNVDPRDHDTVTQREKTIEAIQYQKDLEAVRQYPILISAEFSW